MPSEIASLMSWTFAEEIPIPDDVSLILLQNEVPKAAYKAARDSAIFTNLRIIFRDAQGLRGKKVEIYSLPFSSINMWSSENMGVLDSDSEIELWTRSGNIKIKLGRGIDIRQLDNHITAGVCR
ncbi:PH domain-containing protein [Corynebacterium alimapuense]|uniref:Bacterial Pleckstrin homology domain-containing protein n=1 Tax=Corynebacterium alimapuense TaxID=1576874 RepID=A0A3M8K9E8_9CORY|nr:PH domain-containing protein [Corynebacterium alimapuense]RNE49780.1 hypothetical protein C5L39_04365 [Corynebacterium alimapuense]